MDLIFARIHHLLFRSVQASARRGRRNIGRRSRVRVGPSEDIRRGTDPPDTGFRVGRKSRVATTTPWRRAADDASAIRREGVVARRERPKIGRPERTVDCAETAKPPSEPDEGRRPGAVDCPGPVRVELRREETEEIEGVLPAGTDGHDERCHPSQRVDDPAKAHRASPFLLPGRRQLFLNFAPAASRNVASVVPV